VVSGEKLVRLLQLLGYELIRQKGSHIRMRKVCGAEVHNITIPLHREIAKGTFNDIMKSIATHMNISKSEIIGQLKKL